MSVFARLFAQPERPHNLIAANPRLERLRSGRAFMLMMTALYFFLLLAFTIYDIVNALITSERFLFPWPFPWLVLISLLGTGLFSIQIHYWKHLESQRFAAVLGDDRLRADEQPRPDSDALQVPVTIRMNPTIERRFFTWFFSLWTFLMAAVLFFGARVLFPLFPWLWLLLIAVLVGTLLVLPFLLLARKRLPIDVSTDGIRFQTLYKIPTSIPWHEARLFACYSEPGPWKESSITIYELSSASHVVHWTWARRQSFLDAIWEPSLPFEEHNAQMHALCSLVAAKTGLPLYDLDKGQRSKE